MTSTQIGTVPQDRWAVEEEEPDRERVKRRKVLVRRGK